MWILFFILITSPGQYKVEVLETYKTTNAERECKDTAKDVTEKMKVAYPGENFRDTFSLVCLKQKEKEA